MKLICLILFSFVVAAHAQCETGNYPNGQPCIEGICSGCVNGICCSPDGDATATTAATTIAGFTLFTSTTSGFGSVTALPGCIGPCFDNSCPTSFTCNTATQQCCSGQTTSTTSCRDLIGSKGYSDCPRLQYLCNNATYYDIMTQQCPRTCNRCNTFGSSTNNSNITSSSNCVDKVNARTGISDCPQLAYLCTNPAYLTVMTQQCPRTCGKCSSSSINSGVSSFASSLSNTLFG